MVNTFETFTMQKKKIPFLKNNSKSKISSISTSIFQLEGTKKIIE